MIPVITADKSVGKALEVLNKFGLGIVFVVDENNKLVGVATDGDIRRGLLSGKTLNSKISEIMNKNPIFVRKKWDKNKILQFLSQEEIKKKIPKYRALIVPVLDENDKIVDYIAVTKDDLEKVKRVKKMMAGRPRKALVIGGAGYIGSVLVRELISRGYTVRVLDNFTYGGQGIEDLVESGKIEAISGDVRHIEDIIEAIKDVDAVVHLAAVVGDPSSRLKPKETLEINYLATKMLVDTCKYLGVSRFIFASTCSVYGFNREVVDENSPTNPLSLYAETKLMSEKAILEAKGNGFTPTILRFATVYGYSPRMRFDLVVNLLIAKAIFEKKITVYGEGKQYRPFVHVKDVAQAIIRVLEAPAEKVSGEIFNVGSNGQNYTIMDVAKIIKSKVPEAEIVLVREKEDDRSYKVDFSKIANILGFKPNYTIEDAVEEIRKKVREGEIEDYKKKIYSNFKSLREG